MSVGGAAVRASGPGNCTATAPTTTTPTADRSGPEASARLSAAEDSPTALDSAASGGSSSAPSPGITASNDYGSAGNDATTSMKPSSAWRLASSSTDTSTGSVRTSKPWSRNRQSLTSRLYGYGLPHHETRPETGRQ
jgi:hypothetical protein